MCVGLALLIGLVILRAFEIAHGSRMLSSPKAEDGFLIFAAIILFFVIPYFVGSRLARLIGRSRIRFYRNYQHR